MLHVILPATLITGMIGPNNLTHTRTLIIFPKADVVAAVGIDHAPVPVMLIVGPISIVSLTIRPDLLSLAMALRATPLSLVTSFFVDCLHLVPREPHHVHLFQHL